jgi:predicted GIY-YIG superfamily endonuclease
MKKHYVYIIRSIQTNKVEYVGECINPRLRLNSHVANTNSAGSGTFAGRRNEIQMEIVKEFDNKSEAFKYQCELQKQYGFETDAERIMKQTKDSSGNLLMLSKDAQERKRKTQIERYGVPIIAYDKKTGQLVNEYESISQAAEELNIDCGNLNRCVNGIRYKSVGGYIFRKNNSA